MSNVLGTLRRAVRHILLAFLLTTQGVCLLLGTGSTVQAQEGKPLLRWKNGDALMGRLLESESGQIRWSSPIFAEELLVDTEALDSIVFPKRIVQSSGAFRVGTTSGAVITGDLVGSDESAYLFSSSRFGQLRVNRHAVISLDRMVSPNLTFDGSQFNEWIHLNDGPIKNLVCKIYKGNWRWGAPFPDLSDLTPAEEVGLSAGYFDLGLSRFRERFAVSFAGQVEIPVTGQYRFEGSVDDQAHLWIDGKKVRNDATIAQRFVSSGVALAEGAHTLRLDYVDFGGEARLFMRMIHPDGTSQSLTGSNQASGWQRGIGGHPHTDRKKASIFRRIELPKDFEIDLEVSSSQAPQFVLVAGKDRLSAASNQSIRLETWSDELVVVQDKVFEPVMTIGADLRELRLRLTFNSEKSELKVFDASGHLLVNVPGVQIEAGPSEIYVRNRGDDLTLRRLRVYRASPRGVRQAFDPAKSRVHLMNGRVVYGQLHVAAGEATVVDPNGIRQNVDLMEVDRIVTPGVRLEISQDAAELVYGDGAIVRGRFAQANADHVMLHTSFSQTPVACALAGASWLRFGPSPSKIEAPSVHSDQLFTTTGKLRGELSFNVAGSPLGWRPTGVAKPLRLAGTGAARVERNSDSVAKGPVVDTDRFPCVLHLMNGEMIPCRVLSYDKTTLDFHSPFIKRRKIDSAYVKAIEFTPLKPKDWDRERSRVLDDWVTDILGPEPMRSSDVIPVKLKRALTVPRFSRNNPPSHILVAKNGDLKRGTLLGISEERVQFESKLRKQIIPTQRLTRVVSISKPEERTGEPSDETADLLDHVQVRLVGGSTLLFSAAKSENGKLSGRSSIYGEMEIPVESIRDLNMGDFEKEKFKSLFENWVVRPAREPEFGPPSLPINALPKLEGPVSPAPVTVPPVRHPASDVLSAVAIDRPRVQDDSPNSVGDPQVPDLGKVGIDARDRSLRFPVSINQRSGLVEYAVVTHQGKTHESVFRTDTEPTHIHLGLLLLGATPGYARELPVDPSQKLPGEPVYIDIAWTEGGVERSKPLGDFVVTRDTAATLASGPWVYNGSVLTEHGIAAQAGGSIVSLWLDPEALINNPRPGRWNDELHHANPQAFPADMTQLQMVIRLAKDRMSGE